MDATEPQSASRKRRWYQYSLRTLLIVMVLASVGMSWLTVKMRRAARQREAVEAIRKLGGWVVYDYQSGSAARPTPPGPAWLRRLLGDDFFAEVTDVQVNREAGLTHLTSFPKLRDLGLGYCGAFSGPDTEALYEHLRDLSGTTDATLEHLPELGQLERLRLQYTHVTDAGLERLKGGTHLQGLDLTGTVITDAGVAHLQGLTQLRSLNLNFTRITDAGLEHLKGLTQLQWLGLYKTHRPDQYKTQHDDQYETHVTDQGVEDLQRALPNLKVQR